MNMNKKSIITILFALVAMAGQAQVPLESVRELTMKSEYFNHERQVLIYTPGGYQQFDQTYYDVIYVFDAQDRTMFDLVHCLLNIACKPDPDGGRSTSFIIVGICSPTLWDIKAWQSMLRGNSVTDGTEIFLNFSRTYAHTYARKV